jgi:dephospho-CoA kinase
VTNRRVLGVTGDVGSGKSSVLAWLAAQGAEVLDADRVVHRLLAEDEAFVEAVRRRFGAGVVAAGRVRRELLAGIVFGDPAALTDLESLLHPAVLAETRSWLAASGAAVVAVEAVKLIEGGMADLVDEVWLVTCAAPRRRERLLARGWSDAETRRRMAAGTPLAPRLARADVVIDNSGPWPATAVQLAAAWARS